MTTPSLLDSIDRLDDLLAGLRGIARALDPDPVFSDHDRVNLYHLTMLLGEHLETCLKEIQHLHAGRPERLPQNPRRRSHDGQPV